MLFHLERSQYKLQLGVTGWEINDVPKVPWEVASVTARLLFITCERSLKPGNLPDGKGRASLQEEKHEGLGNYKLFSLISVSGNSIQQIPLEIISRHMKKKTWNKQVIWNSQH